MARTFRTSLSDLWGVAFGESWGRLALVLDRLASMTQLLHLREFVATVDHLSRRMLICLATQWSQCSLTVLRDVETSSWALCVRFDFRTVSMADFRVHMIARMLMYLLILFPILDCLCIDRLHRLLLLDFANIIFSAMCRLFDRIWNWDWHLIQVSPGAHWDCICQL